MSAVTVISFPLPNYQYGGSTAKLRLYVNRDFTDSLDVRYLHGEIGSKRGFFQEIDCTVSGTTLTVPTFTMPSTADAVDPSNASGILVTGVLFDSKGVRRETLFSNWQIPATTPTTFTVLTILNAAKTLPLAPDYYLNAVQVQALIAAEFGQLLDASDVIKGKTYLDVAPAVSTIPRATGINSPQVFSAASRMIIANNMPGADVGAQINAADAALGADFGHIYYIGDGNIDDTIILSDNRHLHLSGVYTATTPGAPILFKNNVTISGDGWGTIIQETTAPLDGTHNQWVVVANYAAYYSNGSTQQNFTLRDIQIAGARSDFDSAAPAIALGNLHGGLIDNVFFNSTRSIGVAAGGASSMGADPLGLGRYSEGIWIKNCEFYRVASQNAAVGNGVNIWIVNNLFRDPGQLGGPGVTPIDCEVNQGSDRMENIQILGNILDSRNVAQGPHGNFIAFQPNGVPCYSRISGNIGLAEFNTSSGVVLGGSTIDLEISNNFFQGMGQTGLSLRGIRLNVFGNTLKDTGTGGNHSVELEGVTFSKFHGNVVYSPTLGDDIVYELSGCLNNEFFNNSMKSIPILQPGSNSRAWNNYDRTTGFLNTDVSQPTVLGPLSATTHAFPGSTSGVVTTQAQAVAGTWMFKWPNSAGSSGQFMQTDGTGVASWAVVRQMMSAVTNTGTAIGASTTAYVFPSGQLIVGTPEGTRQIVIPRACTIRNFYVITSTAQPADGTLVLTIRKNGVDTTVTLTVAANAAAGTFSDLTHSVSFAAGDLMSIKVVNASASPGATLVTVSMEMDTP